MFPFGIVDTMKGRFIFDHEGAEELMGLYRKHGTRLPFDWEHQMLAKPPMIAPAAGWFDLELRDDGLYAVNCEFLEPANTLIKEKKYKFFSPAFNDHKGRIYQVVNSALTNLPAMDNLAPLIAASAVAFEAGKIIDGSWDKDAAETRVRKWASSDGSGDKDKVDLKKYAKAFAYETDGGKHFGDFHLLHHDVVDGELVVSKPGCEAAAGAIDGARGGAKIDEKDLESVKHHIAQHYHQWGGRAPWEPEKTNQHNQAPEHAPMNTDPVDHNAACGHHLASAKAHMKLAQEHHEAGRHTECMAALHSADGEHQLAMKHLCMCMGMPDTQRMSLMEQLNQLSQTSADLSTTTKILSAASTATTPGSPAQEPTKMKTVTKLLSLADAAGEPEIFVATQALSQAVGEIQKMTGTSTPAEAVAKLSQLSDFNREVIAITGAKTPGEALGSIQAMKQGSERATQLSAQLADLAAKAKDAEVKTMVAKGIEEKKISPSQEPWAMSLGTKDPEMLKDYLKNAIPLVAPPVAGSGAGGAGDSGNPSAQPVLLSQAEATAAKNMGLDPVEYQAFKKKQIDAGRYH